MTDKYANLRARLAALKLAGPVSTDPGKWNAATDAIDVELVAELLAERDAMVQAQPAAVSDAEIEAALEAWFEGASVDGATFKTRMRDAVGAILALRPQAESEQEKELRRALAQRPAAQEVDDLPGMWDHSYLSGGETDAKPPIPSFRDLMSAPHRTFTAWCQGPMAYECGDLLAAAAVCRLNDARSIIQSMLADAEGQISDSTMEHVRRFLDA